MSKEKKILEEAMALRYMDLAGVGSLHEEIDPEELSEPVEDAAAGGENLVQPLDHAEIVSGETNVKGVESLDPVSGEVTVSEADIVRIAEAVRKEVFRRSRR